MGKTHSPLLGFNNNVRHKNRVFHIQTEDSGVKHPHIITHLFMDGGRILKSVKKSYAEHVGTDGMQDTVRQMMKEQHKAMFIALRDGQFDAVVDEQVASKAKYDADTNAKKAPAAAPNKHATVTGIAPPAQPPAGKPASAAPPAPVDVEVKGADTKRESVAPMQAAAASVPTDTQKMSPDTAPEHAAASGGSARPGSAPPRAPSAPPASARPPSVRAPASVTSPQSAPLSAAGAPPVSEGAPRYPTPGKQRLVVLPETDDVQPNTMRDPEPPPPLEIDLANSPQPPRLADADLFRSNDLPPPPQNLLKRKDLSDRGTYRGTGEEERTRPKSAPPPKPPQRRSQPPAAPPPAPVTSRGRPVAPVPAMAAGSRVSATSSTSNLAAGGASGAASNHPSSAPARYAPARPATIFGAPRGKASLFGDDLVTDKSLDEVILSYLAEDLEQAPKKK